MLTKLLKYDLKYMIKNMSVFYILALVFALTTRVLFAFDGSAIMKILSQISVGCMFAMVGSIVINVLMRSWVRFRDSIYKDEAYLTHTLPVTKNQIYDSKFILSLIFLIVSFAFSILSVFITYFTKERWQALKEFINTFMTNMDFNTGVFVAVVLILLFLEFFNVLQCGYLGILLGHRLNNGRIGFSVLFGYIAYLVSQSILLPFVLAAGLINNNIMDLFRNNAQPDWATFKLLGILSVVYYAAVICAMCFICKKVFNKGVNVE